MAESVSERSAATRALKDMLNIGADSVKPPPTQAALAQSDVPVTEVVSGREMSDLAPLATPPVKANAENASREVEKGIDRDLSGTAFDVGPVTRPPLSGTPKSPRKVLSLPPVVPPESHSSTLRAVGCQLDTGPEAVFDPLHCHVQQLEVLPITLYNFESKYYVGNLIGVNRNYICYAVRGGMIRVICRSSGKRVLLRGHSKAVSDLRFFSDSVDRLASVGPDGRIYVWHVRRQTSDEAPAVSASARGITYDVILVVENGNDEQNRSHHQRVVWSPVDLGVFATVDSDSVVYVWVVNDLLEGGSERRVVCGKRDVVPGRRVLRGHTDAVWDISFSSDGQCVVTASKDGTVRFWSTTSGETIRVLNPDGSPVASALLCRSDSVLITGTSFNTVMKVWTWQKDTMSWLFRQTMRFAGDNSEEKYMNHAALDRSERHLFVASSRQNALYVFHLSSGDSTGISFDYVAQFSVAQPILSFIVASPGSGNDRDDRGLMELYCVQPKAIQQYRLTRNQCVAAKSSEKQVESERGFAVEPQEPQASAGQGRKADALSMPLLAPSAFSPKALQTRSSPDGAVSRSTDKQLDVRSAQLPSEPNGASPLEHSQREVKSEGRTMASSQEVSGTTKFLQDTRSASAPAEEDRTESHPTPTRPGDEAKPDAESKSKTRKSDAVSVNERHSVRIVAPDSAGSISRPPPADATMSWPGPAGDQQRDMKRLESTLLSKMDKMFQQYYDRQFSRLEKDRSERDKRESERHERLVHAVTQTVEQLLSKQMEVIFENQLKSMVVPSIARIVAHTMENSFVQPVEERISHILDERLPAQPQGSTLSGEAVTQIADAVAQASRKPLQDAFRGAFGQTLVPAFEKSLQSMFAQISSTFERGLDEQFSKSFDELGERIGKDRESCSTSELSAAVLELQQLETKLRGVLQRLAALERTLPAEQASSLQALSDRLSAQVDGVLDHHVSELAAAVQAVAKVAEDVQQRAASITPVGGIAVGATAEAVVVPQDLYPVLEGHVRSGDFENAFNKALSASNLGVVLWLCKQVDPKQVLFSRQGLSQPVVLSLVFQLGYDLGRETELKLLWLHEAVLALDKSDASIADHVALILRHLAENLAALSNELGQRPDVASVSADVRRLQRMVAGLI